MLTSCKRLENIVFLACRVVVENYEKENMTDVKSRIAEPLAGLSRRAHAAFAFAPASACICALALVASFFAGCSGGCSRAPEPESPAPVVDRMNDPEYVAKLADQIKAQKEITARASAVRQELEAARKEDPEGEKTKELETQYEAIAQELEKQRILNMAIIRERINRENAERAKAKTSNGEK